MYGTRTATFRDLGHFRRPGVHFRRDLGVLKYELVLSVTKHLNNSKNISEAKVKASTVGNLCL